MSRFNSLKYFNGKSVVTSTFDKIDKIDGSNLTGLKFTQLQDTPNDLISDRFLKVNSTGDNLEFVELDLNNNKIIEFGISNSDGISWENNFVTITHNLNSYVLFDVYNYEGVGIPVVPLYVDENNIAFHLDDKDLPTDENKHIIVLTRGGITYNVDSYIKPLAVSTISDNDFGEIGVLDDKFSFSFMGYQEVKRLKLKVISADNNIIGNIFINVFGESFVIPVNNMLKWIDIIPKNIYNGFVNIHRETSNASDTLKEFVDEETSIISCKIVDWRLY